MQKYKMLGVYKNLCCILECLIPFDKLDLDNLQTSDFVHSSTDWNGCDYIERTLEKRRYIITGERITLKKPLIFRGVDHDMWHDYEWTFKIEEIWNIKQNKAE